MPMKRAWVVALIVALATACGGGTLSVLHTKGKPTGEGAPKVVVQNSSGVAIERLYIAKSEAVAEARKAGVHPGTAEDLALWGDEQLGNSAISDGKAFEGLAFAPGRYDVLVFDHDAREQLVQHLKLAPGGRYTLEIGDNWSLAR